MLAYLSYIFSSSHLGCDRLWLAENHRLKNNANFSQYFYIAGTL
ncbi:hypothetical protein [Nostoc sp. MS1]|nr:hypothetical protein [Nostoc sp. MS1]